ncbi:MAG TPA: hypothetical protein VIK68_05775 [Sphingomicrobium sp.]
MIKILLALGTAAVAVTAMPAQARHITGPVTCAHWRHHRCVAFRPRYSVGYMFGPSYSYIAPSALPSPFVTRYRLGPHFRYVRQNGYIYVVNPRTYRVVRVIPAF